MNKIFLIIQREYLTRVRKKSFIVMTLLGPVLFAAFMVLPAYFATMKDSEVKKIAVIDNTNIFTRYSEGKAESVLPETEYIKFVALEDVNVDDLKKDFASTGYYALLYIPENILSSESVLLYSDKQPTLEVKNYIEDKLSKDIENLKLSKHNIENLDEILSEIKTSVDVRNIKWTKEGESKESNTGIIMGIGYAAGMLIYFFIFLFGAQVMRGVIEEKSNRIIEVIVSSVKPFELMMGKIIGVGLTGLTQFIIWVVLTVVLIFGAKNFLGAEENPVPVQQVAGNELFEQQAGQTLQAGEQVTGGLEIFNDLNKALEAVDPVAIVLSFLFFFLFGYLLYASMFAVVGAAADNETDTQQFMLPITLPLILGIFVMISTINNPEGPLAFWFSIIPFTSPIVMMVRIPFGVPPWQLILSALLLILTFLGMAWTAGKIYRTGILMYGKKVNYKELWKWLRYGS
ncbi:MAG: ABC transporter permease [Bacteroidota bacterium]